jgi:hypothetical protein
MSSFGIILSGFLCILLLFIFWEYIFWKFLSLFDEDKEDKEDKGE